MVLLVWLTSYGAGGSKTVVPQLFHVPIVVAAARFGGRGALVIALVAGVVAGPLLPLDVDASQAQSTANWVSRLLVFVAVGQITAALHTRSIAATRERIADGRNRADIDAAIADARIVPVYQPIVDLRSGRIEGVEALARWRAPDGRMLAPAAFIPDAERSGAIVALDRAVLDQACAQVADWRRRGVVTADFHVSVNLSAHHLSCGDLPAVVCATLERSGIPPESLVLEVTETALILDPERAVARLAELKELGVGLALDDFGVGQSSLASLARFPIDMFKIDRSFVLGLSTGEGERLMLGVIGLADILLLEGPVAEGIETMEQLQAIMQRGCHRGQGYLLARPALAEDLEPVLRLGTITFPGEVAAPWAGSG
ncbi:MAG: EAL domain-containing protein [Acidimicrobiia bacterium]|nr:EAL domain-containing protein [Acidimicrobiia bacterium]